jgi:hypothetical protein
MREIERYGPALRQAMEYILAADLAIISGVSTLGTVGTATLGLDAATKGPLVLGRGPLANLAKLAEQEGGYLSTTQSTVPKEIFKQYYRDIRSADRITFFTEKVPEVLRPGPGQHARAELFIIRSREDLLAKTLFK